MKNTKTISISLHENELEMLSDLIENRAKKNPYIRTIKRSEMIAELITLQWIAELNEGNEN